MGFRGDVSYFTQPVCLSISGIYLPGMYLGDSTVVCFVIQKMCTCMHNCIYVRGVCVFVYSCRYSLAYFMKLAGWSLGSGFGVNLIFSSNHEFWVASVPLFSSFSVLGSPSMLGMLLLVLGFWCCTLLAGT